MTIEDSYCDSNWGTQHLFISASNQHLFISSSNTASLHQQQQQSGTTYKQHYFTECCMELILKSLKDYLKFWLIVYVADYCLYVSTSTTHLGNHKSAGWSDQHGKPIQNMENNTKNPFINFPLPRHQRSIRLLSQSAIHARSPRQTGDLDPKPQKNKIHDKQF